MKLTKLKTMNEAVEDINTGYNNMDTQLVDKTTVTQGEAPIVYTDAIKKHIERREKIKDNLKDNLRSGKELTDENQPDSHSKLPERDTLKRLKLSEAFNRDGYYFDSVTGKSTESLNESATAKGIVTVTEDPRYVIWYSDGEGTYYYSYKGKYTVDYRGDRYYSIDSISEDRDDAVFFDTEAEAKDYLKDANHYLFDFYEEMDRVDSRRYISGGFDFDFNRGSIEDFIDWLGGGMEITKLGGTAQQYSVSSDNVTNSNDDPIRDEHDIEDTSTLHLRDIRLEQRNNERKVEEARERPSLSEAYSVIYSKDIPANEYLTKDDDDFIYFRELYEPDLRDGTPVEVAVDTVRYNGDWDLRVTVDDKEMMDDDVLSAFDIHGIGSMNEDDEKVRDAIRDKLKPNDPDIVTPIIYRLLHTDTTKLVPQYASNLRKSIESKQYETFDDIVFGVHQLHDDGMLSDDTYNAIGSEVIKLVNEYGKDIAPNLPYIVETYEHYPEKLADIGFSDFNDIPEKLLTKYFEDEFILENTWLDNYSMILFRYGLEQAFNKQLKESLSPCRTALDEKVIKNEKGKEIDLNEVDPFDLVMDTITATGRQVIPTGKTTPVCYAGLYNYDKVGVDKNDNITITVSDKKELDPGVKFADDYSIEYSIKQLQSGKWRLTLDPWTVDMAKLYPDRNKFCKVSPYRQGGEKKDR